ncbi:MAG: head-tail adaptor protein [Rickettsiaceae bacterium]
MVNSNIISQLTNKISILRNIEPSEIIEAKWEIFTDTFAAVKPACDNRFTSIENINFGNIISEEYFIFCTRLIKGLNKSMRIKFQDRMFEIRRIINDDTHKNMLKIIALEI